MDTQSADCIADAVAKLESAKTLLAAEIRRYPSPVAGCDVQYNQLLAERKRVGKALNALREPLHIPTPRAP